MTADIFAAMYRAEAEALAQHEAGTCHLSEWSCSHCEAEAHPMSTSPCTRVKERGSA